MRRFRRPVFLLLFWGSALLLALDKVIEWETEGWWFDALGFSGVYTRMMAWRLGAFFVVGGAYALLLTLQAKFAWSVAARSFAPLGFHPHDRSGRLIPLEDKLGLDRYRSSLTWFSIAAISGLAGLAAAARFDLWLRCYYASPSGQTDVLWHRDLTFYLFKIPAYEAAISFANAALWISLGFSTLIYVYEEALELGGHRARIDPAAARHLSLLFALIVGWQGAGCWLRAGDAASVGTVSMALSAGGYFGTVDALYRVPWLRVGEWMAPLAAAVMLWLLWRRQPRPANGLGLATWVTLWLVTRFVPAWMATAAPNEGVIYPALNLRATRAAWGLDALGDLGPETGRSPAPATLPARRGQSPLSDNSAALQALALAPLWPPDALRVDLAQLLHDHDSPLVPGTPSLEFWRTGGGLRPVYVVACQNSTGGKSGDRTENEGIFVVDAARSGEDGGPWIYASPLAEILAPALGPAVAPAVHLAATQLPLTYGTWPPAPGVSQDQTVPGLYETYPGRPENWSSDSDPGDGPLPAYFDAMVAPSGQMAGGVPLSGAFARELLATRFSFTPPDRSNSGENPAGSGTGTGEVPGGEARLIWHRRVTDRCRQILPLLDWSHAGARLVFDRHGAALWLLDGYAWSHRYPDALAPFADDRANYGRAVALATVDARTGAVNFYARDPNELFTRVYEAIFPGLLQPWAALPPELRDQAQVPFATFVAQSTVWMRLQAGYGAPESAQAVKGWRFALAQSDSEPSYASAADAVRPVWWTGAGGDNGEAASPALLTVYALPPGYSADEAEHTSAPQGCGALVALPSPDTSRVRLCPWKPASPLSLPADLTTAPAVVMLPNGQTEFPPPSLLTILPAGNDFALAGGEAQPDGEEQPQGTAGPAEKTATHGNGDKPPAQLTAAYVLVARVGTLRADSLTSLAQAVSSRPLSTDIDQLQARLGAAREALAAMQSAQAAGDLAAFGAAQTDLQAILEAPDGAATRTSSRKFGNESGQSHVGWSASPRADPIFGSGKDTKS